MFCSKAFLKCTEEKTYSVTLITAVKPAKREIRNDWPANPEQNSDLFQTGVNYYIIFRAYSRLDMTGKLTKKILCFISPHLPMKTRTRRPHPKEKVTPEEDALLTGLVYEFATADWHGISERMGGRNPRQCRDRWLNYLSPEVGNGPWTPDEEQLLVDKVHEFGPMWTHIATFFPTRTDINLKSRWKLMQRRLSKGLQNPRRETAPESGPPTIDGSKEGKNRSVETMNDLWRALSLSENFPFRSDTYEWF
jgi:hypothetical protein